MTQSPGKASGKPSEKFVCLRSNRSMGNGDDPTRKKKHSRGKERNKNQTGRWGCTSRKRSRTMRGDTMEWGTHRLKETRKKRGGARPNEKVKKETKGKTTLRWRYKVRKKSAARDRPPMQIKKGPRYGGVGTRIPQGTPASEKDTKMHHTSVGPPQRRASETKENKKKRKGIKTKNSRAKRNGRKKDFRKPMITDVGSS